MKMLKLEALRKKLKLNHPLHKFEEQDDSVANVCKSLCNQTNITCFLTLRSRFKE
jgi:hypothetical protein